MHLHPAARIGALAVAAAAAALVTGCSGGTSGGTHGSGKPTTVALTAAQVIQKVSSQAQKATSATGTIDMESAGSTGLSMHGTLKMRTAPRLAMDINITKLSAGGQTIQGGMHEILTSKAIYLRIPQLASQTGKPWVKISMAELNSRTGNAFAGLAQQAKQEDPLSAARMLGASKDVKAVGTQTMDGVLTTHYRGTFSFQQALSMLPASMRKLERQAVSTLGSSGTIAFDVWVDAQNHPRKIIESYSMGSMGRITITMQFTSINQPVSIKAPPASKVAAMPGLG